MPWVLVCQNPYPYLCDVICEWSLILDFFTMNYDKKTWNNLFLTFVTKIRNNFLLGLVGFKYIFDVFIFIENKAYTFSNFTVLLGPWLKEATNVQNSNIRYIRFGRKMFYLRVYFATCLTKHSSLRSAHLNKNKFQFRSFYVCI